MIVPLAKPVFSMYVQDRLHKRNKNFLGCFVGPTGSGKSWSALTLARNIDPNFDISKIGFTALEFSRLVKQKWPRGTVLIWDESGVAMSSRSWQSSTNKLLSYILQTFRSRNLCVLFTLPDVSFLDVHARKLLHCVFETQRIEPKRKQTIVKPLMVQVNSRSGKAYYKYLRIKTDDGSLAIKTLRLDMPPKELIKLYEEKKMAFTTQLYDDITKELEKEEAPRPKALSEKQEAFKVALDGGASLEEASSSLGVSVSRGRALRRELARKGVKV